MPCGLALILILTFKLSVIFGNASALYAPTEIITNCYDTTTEVTPQPPNHTSIGSLEPSVLRRVPTS
jgi:hypothetical protein